MTILILSISFLVMVALMIYSFTIGDKDDNKVIKEEPFIEDKQELEYKSFTENKQEAKEIVSPIPQSNNSNEYLERRKEGGINKPGGLKGSNPYTRPKPVSSNSTSKTTVGAKETVSTTSASNVKSSNTSKRNDYVDYNSSYYDSYVAPTVTTLSKSSCSDTNSSNSSIDYSNDSDSGSCD